MHIVTLSFDDGFLKSCLALAGIYEKYGLSACFNVIATGHEDTSRADDNFQKSAPKGDFAVWNELQGRGHEIMPHGYCHANKRKLPLEESKKLISDCLDIFADKLDGFKAEEAVFNFPYNSTTPELNDWLGTQVKAYRFGGNNGLNELPHPGQKALYTTGFGPENCEKHLDQCIESLLALENGWLIYNTHGVDDEGWGPIRSEYLDQLLQRLLEIESVKVLPTGRALLDYA